MEEQVSHFALMQKDFVEREKEKDDERAREREREKKRVQSLERQIKAGVTVASPNVKQSEGAGVSSGGGVAGAGGVGASTAMTSTTKHTVKAVRRTKTGHGDPDGGDDSSSSSSSSEGGGKPPPRLPRKKKDDDDGDDGDDDDNNDKRRSRSSKKVHDQSVVKKQKEADKIVLDKVPTAEKFRAWKLASIQTIASASALPADVPTYLAPVWNKDTTLESLASPSATFSSLDYKLASALIKAAEGELKQDLLIAAEEAIDRGALLTGRQALLIIARNAATAASRGALYGFKDLSAITLNGPADLGRFIKDFRATKAQCKPPVEDGIVQSLLFDQVKTVKDLSYEVNAYERDEPDGPNFSLSFLDDAIDKLLVRLRHKKNRNQIEEAGKGKKSASPLAAVAEEDKSKKKKKSRSRSRSASSKAIAVAVAAALASKGAGKGKDKGKSDSKGGTPRATSPKDKDKDKNKDDPKTKSPKGKGKGDVKVKSPCFLYAEGNCRFGDRCRFLHDAVGNAASSASSTAGAAVEIAAGAHVGASSAASSGFRWQDEQSL
jgi:hypothetical protein